MDQLSSYIPFLPCQKDDLTTSTSLIEQMNKAFNQCELAGIILNCFPRRYEDQYYLNSGTVPSNLTLLRNKLIQIERVVDSSLKRAATSSNSGVKNEKATFGTKHAPAQSNPQDKKKQRLNGGNSNKRYCQLCAEHGGAERTHNTKDCRKYNKEGNLNKLFRSKNKKNDCEHKDPKMHSYTHKPSDKRTFAAISSGLAKLENISSIVLVLGIVNAREAITITNMTVTQRTVTCHTAQCPAEGLGRVLEMKLEKTIKLMFALVLCVLQMHVLRIETNLN